jgi:hypothetical protein
MAKRLRRGNYLRIIIGFLIVLYTVSASLLKHGQETDQKFSTTIIRDSLTKNINIRSSRKGREDLSFRLEEYAARFYLSKGSTAGNNWSDYDQLKQERKVTISIGNHNRNNLNDVEANIGIYAIQVDGRRLLTEQEYRENNENYDQRLRWLWMVIGSVIIINGYFWRE